MISMLKTGGDKALAVLIAEFLSHVEKILNAPTTRKQAGAPTKHKIAKQIPFLNYPSIHVFPAHKWDD